jgi:hypothetical protein
MSPSSGCTNDPLGSMKIPASNASATFGALELIDGNGLKEGDIAGLAYCAEVIHNYFKISRK